MNKSRFIVVLLLVFLVVGVGTYTYYRFNPIVNINTKIIELDEKTQENYNNIDKSQKNNYKKLEFTLNVDYSDNIDDLEINIPYSFRELLGKDVYWSGSSYQDKDPEKNKIEYKDEIIINYKQLENKDIKDLLSKGTITITWKLDGKKKSKTFNIGETITFSKT